MSGDQKPPDTAAEEIEKEITEAETKVAGEERKGRYGEAGDALTTNIGAQTESHGEGEGDGDGDDG